MATYQLNASDLLTLLASTVTGPTEGAILNTLIHNGTFPGPVGGLVGVQTDGPIGAVSQQNNDTIASGTQFELITIPTSTAVSGSVFPTPTVGAATPTTTFNFLSAGGVVIAAGDQATHINDTSLTGGDTLIGGAGFERLTTALGANVLIGGSGQNTLVGGTGADTLIGGGDTRLTGGSGNQTLLGGTIAGAHDTLVGGTGTDLLSVSLGNNRLVETAGMGTLYGGAGNDTLVSGGSSTLIATTGDTRMVSNAGAETLIGGSGLDTMIAAGQTDGASLAGGSGNARIVDESRGSSTVTGGSGGAHVVIGGIGTDSILGGSGSITIQSLQSVSNLVSNSSTAVGGLHTLTFSDGQVVTINDASSNITIHFAGGGTTTV